MFICTRAEGSATAFAAPATTPGRSIWLITRDRSPSCNLSCQDGDGLSKGNDWDPPKRWLQASRKTLHHLQLARILEIEEAQQEDWEATFPDGSQTSQASLMTIFFRTCGTLLRQATGFKI